MKQLKLLLISLFMCMCSICAQEHVEIQLNSDKIENHINDKVYGFLLEHIYHSVSNGLWGENVWNRSFEELLAYGDWEVNSSREVTLNAMGRSLADFRICRGRDYEISVEVKKLEGDGFVLIGMRDQNRERMLTNRIYCHLSEMGNKLELSTGWVWHTPIVKTTVSDFPGNLTDGKWVRVVMRCEGNHLTGWMDENKIIDRVIEDCPRDGAITLGGEDCRVMFRNIRVTSLDNTKIVANLNPVRHWYLVGEGTVKAVHANALNHNTALQVHSLNRLVGIEQPQNYNVRKDDLLKGSVFLRGTVNRAYIQLLDGKKILSEQLIEGISEDWDEFFVELPSDKDAQLATLRIVTKEPGNLYVDQVSFMHQSSINNQGFRVDLTDAVAALKPTILRWPGGSFVEHYDFENGLGKQSERQGILRWDDFDPLSFGTDEFIAFCRKVGAEPQIVVPIGYHNYAGYAPDKNRKQDWLQKALDWLEYCNGDPVTTKWGNKRAENGHPEPYNVKYWEIDNEVWKMDPKLYAEITRLFSIAMKKQDPDIKIIGCGCGRLGREGIGLDSVMIHDVAEYIDYISPHYYQTLDKYGNDGVEEYGRYLDKLAVWIKRSENPDMKIYLSEWNLDGIDMRTGLFAGGFLNRLECTPKLEMAAPALLLRHTSASGWNNAFINFNQNGWFPAPNYVVLKLWRDHFLPNRIQLKGNVKELNIVATVSDDKKDTCLKMVNSTNQSVTVKLKNGVDLGSPAYKVVSTTSLFDYNSIENPDNIKVRDKDIVSSDKDIVVSVPAYSASVLMFRK